MQKTTDNFDFNKNGKQLYFNRIKGIIEEINLGDIWCSITLLVGHENQRLVNFSITKDQFQKYKDQICLGDKVGIRFFLTSRQKNDRWYTSANILGIDKEPDFSLDSPKNFEQP